MNTYPKRFLQEIEEAWHAPFKGWDFAWLKGKHIEAALPWDYCEEARQRMRVSQAMVDIDTGGGEILAGLAPFPPLTCATEKWEENVPVARARLEPLGIQVYVPEDHDHLPFESGQFDLAINRHGSYRPKELKRILKPGGIFLTQQVGGQNQLRLNELLQDEVAFEFSYYTPDYAQKELSQAGFEILQLREDFPEDQFLTIGAVVYFLRIIAWQIEGFTPEAYLDRLLAIDEIIHREGRLVTHEHRFLLEARRP